MTSPPASATAHPSDDPILKLWRAELGECAAARSERAMKEQYFCGCSGTVGRYTLGVLSWMLLAWGRLPDATQGAW